MHIIVTTYDNDPHDARISLAKTPQDLFRYPLDVVGNWLDPKPGAEMAGTRT